MIFQSKLLKPILYFVSQVYKTFVLIRIFAYKIGWMKISIIKTPVISVGNLTVGGTGKTPVVDFLAKEFQNKNLNPAILSKGYGRKTPYLIKRLRYCENIKIDPSFFGDEPYLLAQRNPKVPVFVGNSRVKTSKIAEKKDNPDVIILDDAYQHLKLHRNLNLLLIDTETGFGNGYLLPFGVLREPEKHWKRADAIILTKSNLFSSKNIIKILKQDLEVTCPIFNFNYEAKAIYRLDGKSRLEIKEIKNKNLLAISGIAQPKAFHNSIEKCEAKIISKIDFPDHFCFREEDITKIMNENQKSQPDFMITTEKDAVKLKKFTKIIEDIWVLEMKIEAEKSWNDFFNYFLNSNFD
tara:strand:- start:11 stop:1066 length:1056 start_codon:yes stop_codon:yes gene_type:complete